MTIKSGIGWSLIILAVALAFCVTLKPLLIKKPLQQVSESELFPLGVDGDGKSWYAVIQQETKEWVEILSPLLTVSVACLGIFVGRRSENKRC